MSIMRNMYGYPPPVDGHPPTPVDDVEALTPTIFVPLEPTATPLPEEDEDLIEESEDCKRYSTALAGHVYANKLPPPSPMEH